MLSQGDHVYTILRSVQADEDRGPAVVGVIATCLAVAAIFVILRVYVRIAYLRFGADDWVLAIAAVDTLIMCSITAGSTRLGLGRHMGTLSESNIFIFLKILWAVSMGYSSVIVILKAAFLLQYRRAFPLPEFQSACDIFLAFVGAWALSCTVGAALICQPIQRNWDVAEPTGCPARLDFWLANAIIHVVTDVCILLMPLPLLNTLTLPTMQKAVLVGLFSLGFITCAISIIRATTLKKTVTDDDVTWVAAITIMWSTAEATCAIVCICIPTLRPLLRQEHLGRLSSSDAIQLDDSINENPARIKAENRATTTIRPMGA